MSQPNKRNTMTIFLKHKEKIRISIIGDGDYFRSFIHADENVKWIELKKEEKR